MEHKDEMLTSLHELLSIPSVTSGPVGEFPFGPHSAQALEYADEFLLTAAGQRNRNHVGDSVRFEDVSFAMEEVLFDPQTSGGLLIALPKENAPVLEETLRNAGLPAAIVGEILEKSGTEILVTTQKEMSL